MLERIPDDWQTHMPFLTRDKTGDEVLFFCRRVGTWKLFWLHSSMARPERVSTGQPDDVEECSPTAWHDGAVWHLSFIAGNGPRKLIAGAGESIDSLDFAELGAASAGCVGRDKLRIVGLSARQHVLQRGGRREVAGWPAHLLVRKGDEQFTVELPEATARVVRVAPAHDDDSVALVSFIQGDVVTGCRVNLLDGGCEEVTCDDQPAYKHTELAGRVLYAHRFGGFEERRIRQAGRVVRRAGPKWKKSPKAIRRRLALPGTRLQMLLADLGATQQEGCQCDEMIARMNAWGTAGCREHRPEIVAHLRKEYAGVSWTDAAAFTARAVARGLAFSINPFDICGSLVDEAIRRAERAAAENPQLPLPHTKEPFHG